MLSYGTIDGYNVLFHFFNNQYVCGQESAMSDDFYLHFENEYRGSRELIKKRLQVYLPFLEPFTSLYEDRKVIDLGCGRGEWLETVNAAGFSSFGVDLDDKMLAAARERGFSVKNEDALLALKNQPDESCVVVSAFHLVEHIPFPVLQSLVSEALRVLKPGGLIILETPNPENIVISTNNFYLDPSHSKPIPSLLLSFIVDHSGFARSKVLRLQDSVDLGAKQDISLHDVLSGVSPDYSIVGQKAAPKDVLRAFGSPFGKEYGHSFESLNIRFEERLQSLDARIQHAEKVQELLTSTLNSWSWKITAPMRFGLKTAKRCACFFFKAPKKIKAAARRGIRNGVIRILLAILNCPIPALIFSSVLAVHPKLLRRIQKMTDARQKDIYLNYVLNQELAPSARQIYNEIKK